MSSNGFRGLPMKDLRGYMTEDEVKKLYNAAENPRDKLLIRLLWVTGARISEVVGDKNWKGKVFQGLLVQHVDFREGVVLLDTLKRKEYPPPKRRVSLDTQTLKMVKRYVEENKLSQGDRVIAITRQRANQVLRELGEKAGVKNVGEKPLHNHHLRHSHCVAYAKRNNTLEGLRKLQQKLGHANINTTAYYLQFAPEEQREVEEVFGKW